MDPENRIEPTLGEPSSRAAPEQLNHPTEPARTDFAIKVAIFIIALSAAFWTADMLYDRYLQHQAMQIVEQELEKLEATFESMSEEQAARVRAQRRQRADTTTGKWLAKNCIDWRRSYESMPTETAQTEMQTHCRAYERYLSSGMAPPGAPR